MDVIGNAEARLVVSFNNAVHRKRIVSQTEHDNTPVREPLSTKRAV
jgi:hypothetical protein